MLKYASKIPLYFYSVNCEIRYASYVAGGIKKIKRWNKILKEIEERLSDIVKKNIQPCMIKLQLSLEIKGRNH